MQAAWEWLNGRKRVLALYVAAAIAVNEQTPLWPATWTPWIVLLGALLGGTGIVHAWKKGATK